MTRGGVGGWLRANMNTRRKARALPPSLNFCCVLFCVVFTGPLLTFIWYACFVPDAEEAFKFYQHCKGCQLLVALFSGIYYTSNPKGTSFRNIYPCALASAACWVLLPSPQKGRRRRTTRPGCLQVPVEVLLGCPTLSLLGLLLPPNSLHEELAKVSCPPQ